MTYCMLNETSNSSLYLTSKHWLIRASAKQVTVTDILESKCIIPTSF